ncbi:MAG TPA: hypothetical protein DCQ83_00850 [Fibrobacteres bacterium]|jgi:hypothetical protein|nr:hypothetical protein [Fibrobacterota bacterium]
MLSEEHQQMMLAYLSGLGKGPRFRCLDDLSALSARDLLLLARKVDDAALGLFVQLLKTGGGGESLFDKLMGDHEEENRPLVDAFFNRYFKAVLSNAEEPLNFNPLEVYLPPHVFDDLAFVQSRQPFFLRQRIDVINEYLDDVFEGGHGFLVGEQEKAWEYFWDRVMSK